MMKDETSARSVDNPKAAGSKRKHIVRRALLVGVLLVGVFNSLSISSEVLYQVERGKFERKLSRYFDELPNGAQLLPLEIDGWKLARICGDCGGFESPPTRVCSLDSQSRIGEGANTRRSPGDDYWLFYKGCQMPMMLHAGDRFPWLDIPRLPNGEIWVDTTPPIPTKKQCVYRYPSDLHPSIEKDKKIIEDCVSAN